MGREKLLPKIKREHNIKKRERQRGERKGRQEREREQKKWRNGEI